MKIEDIIIQRDHHHRHHHHHLAAASVTKNQKSGVAKTTKRSSPLVTNAPFPKNHKNETTCTKMSDANNSISATATAIKNGLNGSTTIINTSTALAGSSSSSFNLLSGTNAGSGTTTVAAVTDSRIHVSRANPIHSNINHHHNHNANSNNGTTPTTTTAPISNRHSIGIVRIKTEPVESNDGGADYSTCKSEIVGRLPTSSSSLLGVGAGAVGGGSVQGIGGRLQFFKDGKFILELARAKEGEKSGWVSVPRKQFRSPSATSSTVTPTYPKNESSTSLSFSDDNSSIQSSPWQRDHCWKQSTPRRGISKEMCFHFKRTKHILVSLNDLTAARIKRRRPLDNSLCQTSLIVQIKNVFSISALNKVKLERLSPGVTDKMEDEKSYDDSSTEKEDGSVRESSKTPTPEVQTDTVDAVIKAESTAVEDGQPGKETTSRNMNGEKRLKTRAKLATIIQKLIDRLPTGLFHLSKTQIIGGATQHQHVHSHSHNHISSTASARLSSELHYHQQHVSPRKRILREFEKVSLEDTPTINSKRSRAKGNSSSAVAIGTLPLTTIPTSRGVVLSSSNSTYVTNGNRTEAIGSNTGSMTPNTTPTRLYSSYSIHSLLGGNINSNNSTTNNARIKVEHSVNQGGSGYNDPSYLRAMLASPKSPEGCTNSKSSPYSSSTSGSAKKRSPPYSPLSEIHHQHHSRTRSPNVESSYGNMRSPPEAHSNRSYVNSGGGGGPSVNPSRLTPPHGYLSSPKTLNSSIDNYKVKSENLMNSSPNHYFYSPYMLSPKYVPPPSSISPNNVSDNYHPKLKGAKSPSQQNFRASVFRTQSPHATTSHSGIHRESSPIAPQSSPTSGSGSGGGGMTTSSPSSTPRTVPKKTVSIRRQFASPTSSSSSPGLGEHTKNIGNSSSNNLIKVDERTAMSPDNRRTPTQDSAAVAAATAAAVSKYHQSATAAAAVMMQRSSPLGGGASSLYYMYPPPNGSPSPHHSSSSPSPSPSSSYIPQINPYYHPYVSTLAALRNPLWMHHYPAAAAAAAAAAGAAAAMLPSSAAGPMPPQGVPFFPYNGAAATTPSHMHHSSFAPMHLVAAGQLGLQPPPPPPASLNRSPPTTDDTISPSSIKQEHSSDVPLNLSKH